MPQSYHYAVLFVFCATTASAQFADDTTFLNAAIQNTIGVYQKELKSQAKLYNGSKYPMNYEAIEGEHPFFSSDDWITGDVFYDGELFTEVPLMYDIVTSNLITEHFPTGHAIQLVWGKLKHFTIDGHYFEKIENQSVGGSLPRTDFYDILYGGETKVAAIHQKITRVRIEGLEVQTSYPAKTRYYIFKNGVFFHVQSKASVLKVLKDEKQALKKFLNGNRIIFGIDREASLKSMAEHYDTLKEVTP
jgi:hypothetical protein